MLIGLSRRKYSLSTLKQANVSPHTHRLHERKKPTRFSTETSVYLHNSRSFPSKLVVPCHNKLLLNIIPLWWHPSWCLKSPLKRVFRFLRITLWATTAQFFCAASVLSRSTTELGQNCMFHKSLAQHSSVSRLDCFTAFRTGAPCPPVCTFQGLTSDSQNNFTSDLNSLDLILP